MKLEKDEEDDFVQRAAVEYGCLSYKFKIDGISGIPDRIVICPGGRILFLEFKRGNNQPSDQQKRIQREWRKKGHIVEFVWSADEAMNLLRKVLMRWGILNEHME